MKASDKDTKLNVLDDSDRITVNQYNSIVAEGLNHILVDVRSSNEFAICRLPNSVNIPIKDILGEKAFAGVVENLKANGKLPSECRVCTEWQ